jgi:hypothetical protein
MYSHPNIVSVVQIDYTKEAAPSWISTLDRAKEQHCVLVTKVPWGAHETIRGVRDFTKSSRLRLERFLGLAQERRLKIILSLGLFPDSEAFPAWTLSSPFKSLVPSRFWNSGAGHSLVEVPSLKDQEVFAGFIDFLDEIFSIAALYRHPEGPIDKITLNLSTEQLDLDCLQHHLYEEKLQDRYRNIDKLNLQYGTIFKNFHAASSRKAYRLLSDKRPWLAAFDYKWCRDSLVEDLYARILSRESCQPIKDILEVSLVQKGNESPTENNQWVYYFDPVLIEPFGEPFGTEASLFSAAGVPTLPQVLAFRLFETLLDSVDDRSRIRLLPRSQKESFGLPLSRIVAICGKYVSLSCFQFFERHLELGGTLFFPLQIPQYDENLDSHSWINFREKDRVEMGTESFLRAQKNQGSVWIPEKFYDYGDTLPERVIRAVNEISV